MPQPLDFAGYAGSAPDAAFAGFSDRNGPIITRGRSSAAGASLCGGPIRVEEPMRSGNTRYHSIAAAVTMWMSCVAGASAADGDAKATAIRAEPALQQTSYSFGSPLPMSVYEPAVYAQPSKYYGPWEPTEIFGHDARCAPTPYAPRGYGFPKKLAHNRMDYAPYRIRDCGLGSIHGPAYWWRRHRDPCCDPTFGCCRRCNPAVDPQ